MHQMSDVLKLFHSYETDHSEYVLCANFYENSGNLTKKNPFGVLKFTFNHLFFQMCTIIYIQFCILDQNKHCQKTKQLSNALRIHISTFGSLASPGASWLAGQPTKPCGPRQMKIRPMAESVLITGFKTELSHTYLSSQRYTATTIYLSKLQLFKNFMRLASDLPQQGTAKEIRKSRAS